MPQYLFAYHGGKTPETPKETETEIGRWQSWFDRIGDAIIDPGNPVGMSRTVSAAGVREDGGPNPLSGYTIIQTDTFDKAVKLAKACPIIGEGSIEVAEIHEVAM